MLLYAIVGTLINVVLIGPSLWFSGWLGAFGSGTNISLIECLCFSTLISAVDPVAVLAIFQELGVNKALYFLVFGESLLNDAVVIVLYNSVTVFAMTPAIEAMDVVLGVCNFFTVSGGGLFIGFVLGGLTAIITRFTHDVRVVEPMVRSTKVKQQSQHCLVFRSSSECRICLTYAQSCFTSRALSALSLAA